MGWQWHQLDHVEVWKKIHVQNLVQVCQLNKIVHVSFCFV